MRDPEVIAKKIGRDHEAAFLEVRKIHAAVTKAERNGRL